MANIELNTLVNRITAQRQAQLPQVEGQIKKLQQISTALNDLKLLRDNQEFSEVLAGIRFEDTARKIALGQQALDRAKQRLSRKNISIAVAGKARQGKSQLLQMLTGLGNEQIPTGGLTFCTAARSRITNNSGVQSATVHFLTESEFLEKKIWPAYITDASRKDALGLSPRPSSVSAFLSSPLPELTDPSPSKFAFYSALQKTHQELIADPKIVSFLGISPMVVALPEVVNYVTKDQDNLPKYYHVVDYVEIHTPFAVGLPEGMEVFDLPGLGEMTANIRETMLNAIKNDADIILFLRRPVPGGDAWIDSDLEAFDMLSDIYKEEGINPNDWISLILNKDTREAYNNEKNVESMKSTTPKGFKPIVCDCGSHEAVNSMISTNMQMLLANAKRIDDVCIAKAKRDFEHAIQAGKDLVSQLETAKGNLIASSSDFQFDEKFEEFMADLRAPFKSDVKEKIGALEEKIMNQVRERFMDVYKTMEEKYSQVDAQTDKFPDDFPVFTPKKLLVLCKKARGSDEVVDEAVRNQLWALVELMRKLMTISCDEVRSIYLEKMVELVVGNNTAIQKIIEKENGKSDMTADQKLECIANAIERVDNISTVNIVSALKNLRNLTLTYEQHILPLFYENPTIQDFDPCSKTGSELDTVKNSLKNFGSNFEKQRDALYTWLKSKSEEILSVLLQNKAQNSCSRISNNIYLIIVANYRNFVNQFIWGKTVENEWKDYVNNQKSVLWEAEFNEAAAKSSLNKEFLSKITAIRNAVNL